MSRHRPSTIAVFAVLIFFTSAVSAQDQPAPTAETILTRMAQSLGGLEKLRQVENIYMRAKVEVAGLKGTVDDWQTARGQHKQFVDLGEVYQQTTIFDGSRGWVVDRNGHINDLSGLALEKEVLASYVGSFSYLISGRLSGQTTFSGEDKSGKYYLIAIKPDGGAKALFRIDKSTFLPFSAEVASKQGATTTYFEDWREVEGIKMPFRQRQIEPNPSNNALVQQQSIQFNSAIAATNFARPAPSTPDFQFTNGEHFSRIPIDRDGNALCVQARINGSRPLWFALDTGASVTLLDERRVRALGLKPTGKIGGSGTGGSFDVKFTKGVSLTFPGVKLTNQSVATLQFRKQVGNIRPNFGGILGYDFISRFVVEIDYVSNTLTLYDAATYEYKGLARRLPISVEGTPFVSAQVKVSGFHPVVGRFEIDTGYDGAIALYGTFLKDNPTLQPAATTKSVRQGIRAATTAFKGRVERFDFGDFSFPNVVVDYTIGRDGSEGDRDVAGLIGNEILRRFKVIFDYSRHEMILEPNTHLNDPF